MRLAWEVCLWIYYGVIELAYQGLCLLRTVDEPLVIVYPETPLYREIVDGRVWYFCNSCKDKLPGKATLCDACSTSSKISGQHPPYETS